MEDMCQELLDNFTLIAEKENLSLKHILYPLDSDVWKQPDFLGYTKLVAYAIILIGGLLGNIGVILTVVFNRSMRTTINFYITNLAVADALICIFCMIPHALAVLTGNMFVLGEFMCKFNPFTQMMCLTSSVLTLSAISCDRFMAVMFPLHVRITKQRTSVVLTIVWIISITVSLPFLIVKNHLIIEWKNFLEAKCLEDWPVVYIYDESSKECITRQPMKYIYYIVLSITLFFLPIIIMITAYSLIIRKLWSTEVPGEQHEANVNAHSKSRRKVIKMVFTVLIAFVICWTPVQGNLLYTAFDGYIPDWFTHFEWFSYYIAYANSFINPIIYGVYNKTFRDGFCILLQCGCKKNRSDRLARWRSTLSTRLTMISTRVSNMSRKTGGS